MRTELHYYDIFPKVFPAGKEVTITIKPLGHHANFENPDDISLHIFGWDDGNPRDYPHRGNGYELPFEFDGCIRFTHTFPREQQYYVRIMDKNTGKRLLQLSVYALAEDLCGRYPLIGDLHMHTCCSDGHECPAIVSANYRKHGYDFFAITDHNRYYPSLEAIETYKDVPIEFNICVGEEVHLPDLAPDHINDVHIVNFGGKWSVNGLHNGSSQFSDVGEDISLRAIDTENCPAEVMSVAEYERQVEEIAANNEYPEGVAPFVAASCQWGFEHIQAAGGLAIFAHPYWINNTFHVSEKMTDFLFDQNKFDAFEVLGGEAYLDQNEFQVMHYNEARIRGVKFPVVGSSDVHSITQSTYFPFYYTVCFAERSLAHEEFYFRINSEVMLTDIARKAVFTDFYDICVNKIGKAVHNNVVVLLACGGFFELVHKFLEVTNFFGRKIGPLEIVQHPCRIIAAQKQ